MYEEFEKWLSQPDVAREWKGTHAEHLRRIWEAATLVEREACARIAERYEPDEKLSYVTYASRDIRNR